MLRPLFVASALTVAGLCVASAQAASDKTPTPLPGAYTSLAANTIDDCIRACRDDGLCMAWGYHATGACELMAIVPMAQSNAEVTIGLSQRAPSIPRRMPEQPAAIVAQAGAISELRSTLPPARSRPVSRGPDTELLGGPDDGDFADPTVTQP